MGRLAGRRARVLLTVATIIALPLAALLGANLRGADGAPVLSLVLAVLVVHSLSIGPRSFPVTWYGMVLEATVARGVPLDPAVLVGAGVQAGLVVAFVLVLEHRFAHHGPVRKPIVMVEFGLIVGAGLPFALGLTSAVVGRLAGIDLLPGGLLHCAAAAGVGVLALTPGLRMLVKGQLRHIERSGLPTAAAAAAVSSAAVVALIWFVGESAESAIQVVTVPVLAIALLMGTVGYALVAGSTVLLVACTLAPLGTLQGMTVPTSSLVAWWVIGFVGLLLATDGDRRRAAAVEFRSFFERSAAPSLTVNTTDGTVLRANEAVGGLLARPAAELVGRPLHALLPDDESLRHELRRVRLGELDEVSAEFTLPGAQGGERWVRCMAVRVDLGGPQHDVVQVQFVDLTTERVRTISLERSNESLEQFGRRVTHDLKQPVSAVAAYASTLLEHGERMAPEMVHTMHERLAAAARRAVQQLDDTFAAAAARDPGRVDVRLHELVADVVGVMDLALGQSGATLATNLMRGHVHSDPASIRQILLNLLTNSLKYHQPGEAPRISISSRVRHAGVEVVVTDNGTGIPPDALTAVFSRGTRLAPHRADGRGHGLADSRDLAAALGGTLEAEPWPDGARFVLWLPDPAAADAQTPTRVLVVTDAETARTQVQQRLGRRSSLHLVGTASSVGEAVVAARDTRPDVVLLDQGIVAAAGVDGVVEIARAHRDARLVLLVGEDRADVDDAALRAAGAVRTVDLRMDDDDLAGGLLGSAV